MGMQSVSIIGVGRVGGALAIALSRSGFRVDYLVHRDDTTAKLIAPLMLPTVRFVHWSSGPPVFESDVVLITTADPDIELVAAGLRDRLRKGSVVIHTSGSLSSQSLYDLERDGNFTASMHPLVSVSDAVSGAGNFRHAFFCVEGDDMATSVARSIVEALEGRAFSIDSKQKPLYHAAAVTACGHLVALIDIAIEMLSKCGIEKGSGQEILLPLISSTITNLQTHSPERALTGSFARLDADAIGRHLSAIDRTMSHEVKDAYLLLGERSLMLAAGADQNPGEVEKVRNLISMAKRKCG
jgi:predicted short-subunit dehydrogenase-like oxidoreductase (DUF2520 family)